MKKLILATVSIASFITLYNVPKVMADTIENEEQNTSTMVILEGLTPGGQKTSDLISPFGAYIPTSNKNVANSTYNMQASYGGKYYLYSNFNVYGKNTYNYYFQNQGRGMLEIRLRHSISHTTLKHHYIPGGGGIGPTISDSLKMTDKNSKFYFEFYSTSDYVFSGYVK